MNDILYYDCKPLILKGAELQSPFIGIIGGKGNGKTYSCCDYGIRKFFTDNIPFVYVRRMSEMLVKGNIQNLLTPHIQTIINLTNGMYNAIKYISKSFIIYNKNDKKIEPKIICYCRSLATLESQTGADLGEISCIIYDEFMSRERELENEFNKLMICHSNLIRNRTDKYTPFILLGNTFTRDNVVLRQFGVNMYNIKQGEIVVSKSKSGEIRLLLEYCNIVKVQENAAKSFYDRFDNNELKMITYGSWVMSDYQTIPQNYNYSKAIGTIALQSPKGRILISICLDITPYVKIYKPKKNNDINVLISSKTPKTMRYPVFNYIPNIPILRTISKCLATKRIYCDLPENVELLRDILNDICSGESLRKYLK